MIKLLKDYIQKQKLKNSFNGCLSPIVQQFIDEGFSRKYSATATVLITNMVDYVATAEKLQPLILSKYMNRYFEFIIDSIHNRDGYVDNIIGDKICAFWNVVIEHNGSPILACDAAIEQRENIYKFNQWAKENQYPTAKISIGIATGNVTVGNFGSGQTFLFRIIGDIVNVCAHLEQTAKDVNEMTLVDEQTKLAAKGYSFSKSIDIEHNNSKAKAFSLIGKQE